MHSERAFRLFISSTFSDFIAEREALQKRVFPELEAFCRERGASFQAVDLRWGITEEAQQSHETLRLCLEAVRRCQAVSPRPNFAVLLGDRYGWEPVPARIPEDCWHRLVSAADEADQVIIQSAYRGPDRNAIPAVYQLKPCSGDWAESQAAEGALLEALRRAADAAGFSGDERLAFFASATHQEIALGALAEQDESGQALHPNEHVHVFSQRIPDLPRDQSARAHLDFAKERSRNFRGRTNTLRCIASYLKRQRHAPLILHGEGDILLHNHREATPNERSPNAPNLEQVPLHVRSPV